jgi:hypothetical protein
MLLTNNITSNSDFNTSSVLIEDLIGINKFEGDMNEYIKKYINACSLEQQNRKINIVEKSIDTRNTISELLPEIDNLFSYLSQCLDTSVELKRNKMKDVLQNYYEFKSSDNELDFIESNSPLLEILPNIGKYLKSRFDPNTKLELDLLVENPSWQTLFINIYTNTGWEKSNQIIDSLFESLFEMNPLTASKLNVSIIPNEF